MHAAVIAFHHFHSRASRKGPANGKTTAPAAGAVAVIWGLHIISCSFNIDQNAAVQLFGTPNLVASVTG